MANHGEANPGKFGCKWNTKWNSAATFADELKTLLSKSANQKLAERVGVVDRDFTKANECNAFTLI